MEVDVAEVDTDIQRKFKETFWETCHRGSSRHCKFSLTVTSTQRLWEWR
jgi:hypothetical protein